MVAVLLDTGFVAWSMVHTRNTILIQHLPARSLQTYKTHDMTQVQQFALGPGCLICSKQAFESEQPGLIVLDASGRIHVRCCHNKPFCILGNLFFFFIPLYLHLQRAISELAVHLTRCRRRWNSWMLPMDLLSVKKP